MQQSRTAESEVQYNTLPCRPLTLLQNSQTTDYDENRVSIRPVYHIQRFIFIHYQQRTQDEPMLTVTVATHQGPNSIIRPGPARFINTPTFLCHTVTTQMLELEA